MYFSQIRIDPVTDSRVYVLGTSLHVSDDGGKTFRDDGAKQIHVDFHAMWIDPTNPDHVLIGGDGGVAISHDRSKTYVWLNNLPVGQFYHASYDFGSPYTICGGLQDNDTWCGPSAVRSRSGIANDYWFTAMGGDGFVGLIDPTDPRVIYAEMQDGLMVRVDRGTNERQTLRPEPAAGTPSHRWNWDTPMQLSPHDPAVLYIGANRVLRSTDRGLSFKVISNRFLLRDTPMQWDGTRKAGFSSAGQTWLPIHGNYKEVNVQAEDREKDSLLNMIRTVLAIRNRELPFRRARWNWWTAYPRMYWPT